MLGQTALGRLLAPVVAAACPGAAGVLLVPVPATAAAVRRRHGDHVVRLARHATGRLRSAGWPASTLRLVRARPRPDSAGLDRSQRAMAAADAYTVRPAALRRVLLALVAVALVGIGVWALGILLPLRP